MMLVMLMLIALLMVPWCSSHICFCFFWGVSLYVILIMAVVTSALCKNMKEWAE